MLYADLRFHYTFHTRNFCESKEYVLKLFSIINFVFKQISVYRKSDARKRHDGKSSESDIIL